MTSINASNIRMDTPSETTRPDVASTPSDASGTAAKTATTNTGATGATARPINHDAVLNELSNHAGTRDSAETGGSTRTLGPALPPPDKTFSTDEMVALLRTLQEKTQSSQIESAKKQVETSQIDAKQNHAQQMEKIDKWVEESRKAEKSGLFGKIFGWIGKIAAVVASLAAVVAAGVATVVSGGTAAPLLVVASIGLVASTMSLASHISQELGGPEISFGNLIGTVVGKLLQAFGVDEETANKIGRTVAGAAALALPVLLLIEPSLMGDFVAGICGLAGVDEKTAGIIHTVTSVVTSVLASIAMIAMSGGSGAVGAAAQAGKVMQFGAQIASGAADVGQGAASIDQAKHQHRAENAIADKEKLSAMMLLLQQNMEENREELEKVIKEIEEGNRIVTQMINDAADSMGQVTRNLRGQGAV